MAITLASSIPPKDPSAILDYSFDWSSWLATNETISNATVTVPAGIMLYQAAQVSAGVVTFWLSGGAAGNFYPIECTISTSQGRTDSRSFQLTVQQR